MAVELTEGLDYFCCDCGIAIRDTEIDGEFVGRLVDYGAHRVYEYDGVGLRLPLCSGCLGRMKENTLKSQGDHIMKRMELNRDGANVGGQIKIEIKQKDPTRRIDSTEAIEEFKEENQFGTELPDGTGQGI